MSQPPNHFHAGAKPQPAPSHPPEHGGKPIVGTDDPVETVRRLIETLQETARRARSKLWLSDEEKDDVSEHIEAALDGVDYLRAILEPEAAEADESGVVRRSIDANPNGIGHFQAAEEARQKFNVAVREWAGALRQRDDGFRQRDEVRQERDDARRKLDAITSAARQSAALMADSQKQIIALRHTCDDLRGQVVELTGKLGRAENKLARLGHTPEPAAVKSSAPANPAQAHPQSAPARRAA